MLVVRIATASETMTPLSVLLLLAAPASLARVISTTQTRPADGTPLDPLGPAGPDSPPWHSPCWNVQHNYYNSTYDMAKAKCESIRGCTYVTLTFYGVPCAPTAFMDAIEPGACSSYTLADQLSYWQAYQRGWSYSYGLSSPDMCEWTNCLKSRVELCPSQVPDWQDPDDRRCRWHNGKCQQSVLTEEWLEERRDLLAEAVSDDADALHRCAVGAMKANGLTASRSDFGCGASVLSPDCVAQVTAMGNDALSCGKKTLQSSVQTYYDDNLRWEVANTRELYDCVAEGIQQCPFSQGEFCASVQHLDWEIPSVAGAKACVSDYNCLVPHYNACARKAGFVIQTSLRTVRLPKRYQRALDTQVCLKKAATMCGGSLEDISDGCFEFTNVVACAANLRCYIAALGQCGYENYLWDKDTANDMLSVGPTITNNAKCFARELQECEFHKNGGFCSNGDLSDFAAVGACLADFTCMAKAIAPCQAGQELLFAAARGIGGRCREVDEACNMYCSEHVTSSYHNKQQCVLYCRIDSYVRCTLLWSRSTYVSWSYDPRADAQNNWREMAVVSDDVERLACFEQAAPACGFDEATFCKMADSAAPTDAEAEACTVQTKCAADTLWTCLDKSRGSVAEALKKIVGAVEATYDKHTGAAEATRACVVEKEALCGVKMSSLGYNTALCLANREACEERARCIVKEAHACGVQSGLLRSAAQDLLDSTSYTRCMLAEFQGTDLAQKIADLDSDFFFHPSSHLMRAHAKCAGWSLSKLTTILPDSAVDPARRQISSSEFCARSLASICEPLSFDPAEAAACALLATYRCHDGSAFNKKVDACFADAAGECGAVKGQKTWANVQGVDCVNDVVKCAEMAACLTAKASTCLGSFLGGEARTKLDQASSWTADLTERYVGWGKKAGGTGGGTGSGSSGGAPHDEKSSSIKLWIVIAAAGGGAMLAAIVAGVAVKARAPKATPHWENTVGMGTEGANVENYEIPTIEEAVTLDVEASRHLETDPMTVPVMLAE